MPSYSGDPNAQDPASYSNGMTGSCLCGSISVTITKSDLFTKRNGHLCHCSNCRKVTGCTAANNLVIEQSNVQVRDPKGYLKTYNDQENASGLPARRSFCFNCGRYVIPPPDSALVLMSRSPICSIPTDSDEQYVLPLGIFPLIPEPEFELFAAHRHAWEPQLEGTKKYRFMTSSGELEA